jgi:uncharacterized protein (TIGR02421 family)
MREDAGTDRLLFGQPSYVLASGHHQVQRSFRGLVRAITVTLQPCFGSFLVFEIWSAPCSREDENIRLEQRWPVFRIHVSTITDLSGAAEELAKALKKITVAKEQADVDVLKVRAVAPPGQPALLTTKEQAALGVCLMGLEIQPVYRDVTTGQVYPEVLRSLHRGLTRAFRRCFFEFARSKTTHVPPHYHALGRRAVVKAVWEVDRQLAQVSDAFDFLLSVTPTNVRQAWATFRHARFEKAPTFMYRPLSVEPAWLKRKLYDIPLERIEDPAIAHMFREKQQALDRKLTMLADRETPRFFHGSMQLFGGVPSGLAELADSLLEGLPARTRDDSAEGFLDGEAFSRHALAEISHYRRIHPDFSATVETRDDVTGLMVSRGTLLVEKQSKIPVSRANALLQHEVGTHLVTYYNGRAQPFRQLYSGLAGYDESQEGLAVLAEYMAGGLSRPRLRLLAGRVVAVRCLMGGATFADTFRELVAERHFARPLAFTVTARVYRGGGLTKDAIYLKGMIRLLKYLRNGGSIEPLLVGKINSSHIPIIKELQWRQVLKPAPLQPRYLYAPGAEERLARLRNVSSLRELTERRRGE